MNVENARGELRSKESLYMIWFGPSPEDRVKTRSRVKLKGVEILDDSSGVTSID